MSDRAPYSRVYWSIVDDPKFATIFDDDRRLATWLRLLVIADQAHPASANIPIGTHRPSILALVDCGLIDLGTGSRYRIHGLDKERLWRREAATSLRNGHKPKRDPDGDQTGPEPEADGFDTQPRRRDETRQAETSRANARDDNRPDLEMYLLLKRRIPTPKQRRLLDEVMDRHDLTGPEWAADLMAKHPDDPIGAVIEADKAWRAEQIAAAQAAEAPKPKPRRSPGLPQTTREIMAEMAALKRMEATA